MEELSGDASVASTTTIPNLHSQSGNTTPLNYQQTLASSAAVMGNASSISNSHRVMSTTTSQMPDLPAHLRDHLFAKNSSQPSSKIKSTQFRSTSIGKHSASMTEGELLPPIPTRPLIPENLKVEPPLSGDVIPKRVVVCGAGIIGLTTSYYLAKLGHEVLCVEKESEVGTQVSFCNGAFLDPSLYQSWADFSLLKRGPGSKPKSSGKKGQQYSANSTTPMSNIPISERKTATNQEGNSNSEDQSGNSKAVRGGRSASFGGDDNVDETRQSPEANMPPSPIAQTQPTYSSSSSWERIGKTMKLEAGVLKDRHFWTWGMKFLMNCKKQKADEHGRTIRELGFYSMLKLRELQFQNKKEEVDMDQTAQGTLEVFGRMEEMQAVLDSDRKRHLDELGMELQPLNGMEAIRLEPAVRPDILSTGSILSAFGTNGDVHKMCQNLYMLCIQEGVMFRFNTEVIDILKDKTQVIALQTRKGSLIEGDAFVLALGNSTPTIAKRAGLKLSIYPVKGYILSVPVNERRGFPMLKHNIYAGGQALISPLGSVLRISGGVDFSNPKKAKPGNEQKRFDWLLSQAKLLFPDGYMDESNVTQHVCWRPVTADDVPLIGRTMINNLFVNSGHGSKGWTLSFGAAALLADEISGRRPQLDMMKFHPHRFGMFG